VFTGQKNAARFLIVSKNLNNPMKITCISQINTLEIIREIAAHSFKDLAVVSVIIHAAWGRVEVLRDGTCQAAH
jgi:hypothetical protein